MPIKTARFPCFLQKAWWHYLLLAAFVAAVYLPTIRFDFVWDDSMFVVDNTALDSWKLLPKTFFSPYAFAGGFKDAQIFAWRPVRNISYMIDIAIHGKDAWLFHLHNVLLQVAVACLLLCLIRQILKIGLSAALFPHIAIASWIAAAAWAMHPIMTEVVAWVKSRDDLLCALFSLGALNLWVRLFITERARDKILCGVGIILLGVLALLSKENAAMNPALAFAIVAIPTGTRRRIFRPGAMGLLGVWVAMTVVYVVVRHFILGRDGQGDYIAGGFIPMMATMAPALVRYLHVTFWPFWPTVLVVDYTNYSLSHSFGEPRVWLSTAIIVALAIESVWISRKRPVFAIGIAFCAIAMFPFLNIVPMLQVLAERFLYVPLMGLSIVLAAVLAGGMASRFKALRGAIPAIAVMWLAAATASTMHRLPIWRSDRALFTNAVMANPISHKAAVSLLSTEINEYDYPAANRDAAEIAKHFPGYFMFTMYQGDSALRLGKEKEGRALIELSESQYPISSIGWRHLGAYEIFTGQYDAAIATLRKATQTEPMKPENWIQLSEAYIRTRQFEKAEDALRQATNADRAFPAIKTQYIKIFLLREAAELKNRAKQ